jgi:putative endonuclease
MYFVYIIYASSYDKYYIGSTNNLKRRLNQHNNGENKSTKPYTPYEYRWVTKKDSRREAEILERKIKNFKSKKRLRVFMDKYESLDVGRR